MVKITAVRNWIRKEGLKDFDELGIQVKQYLPINDKLNLVARILLFSTVEEDGVQMVNAVYKKLFYEIEMLRAYSNLDFSTIDKHLNEDNEKYTEKLIVYYDDLKASGLVDAILERIDIAEIRFIQDCIEEQIRENNRVNNSLAGVVGRALNRLIDKLPDEEGMERLIKDVINGVQSIDPQKLQYLSQAIGWNRGIDISKVGD